MEIILESKTKPTTAKKAIKYGGNWYDVVGNAGKYLDNLEVGATYTIKLDDANNVVFIGSAKGSSTAPANRDERISKAQCFNCATTIVAAFDNKGKVPVDVALQVRHFAEAMYKELKGFLESETTADGIEIPMK